jgi:hypothetical protein
VTLREFVAEQVGDRKVTAVSGGKVTSRMPKRVHTLRGIQHHHGYYGYVLVTFEGARQPETMRCCFHLKSGAARTHAEAMSKAFARHIQKES